MKCNFQPNCKVLYFSQNHTWHTKVGKCLYESMSRLPLVQEMAYPEQDHYLNACSFMVNWTLWTSVEFEWEWYEENAFKWWPQNILPQSVVTDLCHIFFVLCLGIFHFLHPKEQPTATQWHFDVSRIKVERMLGTYRVWRLVRYVQIYNVNNSQDTTGEALLNDKDFHSSPPEQNGRHFADDIFRCIFVNGKFCILIEMSL